jgi:prepilin-type processing-associated H-X9-DG protein
MLLPALARAKAKAQDIQCVNNCKQIVLMMSMYALDNQGKLISYDDPAGYGLWIGRLQQNYRQTNNAVRICPATKDGNPWTPPATPAYGGFGLADYTWCWVYASGGAVPWHGSYGINGYCYDEKEAAFTKPSKSPYFADCNWVDTWPGETETPARNLYTGGDNNSMERLCIARHGGKGASAAPRSIAVGAPLPGKINIGFGDGHVEPVRLESLWTLYWSTDWVIPPTRPR